MQNFLVHATDENCQPYGEPLYSGDVEGCSRYVNSTGINDLSVIDAETSAQVTAVFQGTRAAILIEAFGPPEIQA